MQTQMGTISGVCFPKKKITEYILAVEVSMWQSNHRFTERGVSEEYPSLSKKPQTITCKKCIFFSSKDFFVEKDMWIYRWINISRFLWLKQVWKSQFR